MMRKTSSNSGSSKEENETSPRACPPVTSNKDNDNDVMFGNFSQKTFVMYMTHFNIVLYALCYWIQIGVLPVSCLY